MLIKDLNDTSEALHEIAQHLQRLKPDRVHITLPIRPPAEIGIQPSDEPGMLRAKRILGEISPVSIPVAIETQAAYEGDLCETILNIVTRHPMQEDEMQSLLNHWSTEQVHAGIQDLNNRHLIKMVVKNGSGFWSAAAATFHDKTAKWPGSPA